MELQYPPDTLPALRGRGAFALNGLMAAGAVLTKFVLLLLTGGEMWFAAKHTLGYFTVWTNIGVSVICLSIALGRRWTKRRAELAAAATLFILFVGLIYYLLISRSFRIGSIATANELVLHYAVPAAMLVLWLGLVPRGLISRTAPLVWLIFPLSYLAMALAHGAWSGSYPYHFLDLERLGIAGVLTNGLILTLVLLGAGQMLVSLDRLLLARR